MNKIFFLICLAIALYASGIFGSSSQDKGEGPAPLISDMALDYSIKATIGNKTLHEQNQFLFKKNKEGRFNCTEKVASDNISLYTADTYTVDNYFVPEQNKFTLLVNSYPIWLPADKLENNDITGYEVTPVRWKGRNAFKLKMKNVKKNETRYYRQSDGIFLGATLKTKKVSQLVLLNH